MENKRRVVINNCVFYLDMCVINDIKRYNERICARANEFIDGLNSIIKEYSYLDPFKVLSLLKDSVVYNKTDEGLEEIESKARGILFCLGGLDFIEYGNKVVWDVIGASKAVYIDGFVNIATDYISYIINKGDGKIEVDKLKEIGGRIADISDDMNLVYLYDVIKGTGTEDYLKAYIGNIENGEVGRHDINGGDILVREGSLGEYIKVLNGVSN